MGITDIDQRLRFKIQDINSIDLKIIEGTNSMLVDIKKLNINYGYYKDKVNFEEIFKIGIPQLLINLNAY